MGSSRALLHRYPRRVEVPLLLAICAVLLWQGLSLPLFELDKSLLWMHWRSSYSVARGIVGLWGDGQYFLAVLVLVFSLIFPILKLVVLTGLWVTPMRADSRARLLAWLDALGKWSMLDVFAVAVLVVAVKIGPLAHVHAERGVYFFCAAILVSMATAVYVRWLARRSPSRR